MAENKEKNLEYILNVNKIAIVDPLESACSWLKYA